MKRLMKILTIQLFNKLKKVNKLQYFKILTHTKRGGRYNNRKRFWMSEDIGQEKHNPQTQETQDNSKGDDSTNTGVLKQNGQNTQNKNSRGPRNKDSNNELKQILKDGWRTRVKSLTADMGVGCFLCGEMGHSGRICPKHYGPIKINEKLVRRNKKTGHKKFFKRTRT